VTFLLQQLVNGVALGGVYALIAIGFTLIFGVLRLLNMAHGELYMLGAYLAYLFLSILNLPLALALILVLISIAIIALAIEYFAFRPLRDAPHFVPLVSTIAVSTILLELVRLAFGPYMFGFDSFIPVTFFHVGVLSIASTQMFMLALSAVLTVALQLFLSSTQWGRAIRCVAEDVTMSGLLGINVNRIISVTFAIGSVLGAVAGILVAMHFGAIYPNMGFVALVKAFTAAILGGMGSVPGAAVGGILLGVVESLGSAYLPSGFSDAVPYVVLFAVLLLRPAGLFRRVVPDEVGMHSRARRVTSSLFDRMWPKRWVLGEQVDAFRVIAISAGIIIVAIAPFLDNYALRILITIVVYAMMALGTDIILGLAGQLSLSHAAFFAIGAYASAVLTTRYELDGWSAMAIGVIAAGAAGALLSLVTFRLRGYYLALVTLSFAELIRIIISHWNDFTGGMMGIRAIPALKIGSWPIDSPLAFFYLSAVFGVAGLAIYNAIAYSVKGRALIALRDDEIAASASSLGVQNLKIVAFTLSAVFPAVGGALMAHYYTAITPDFGSLNETLTVLVIVVIGGLGSAAGAVFGSVVVNLLPELFRDFGDYRLLVYGVILFLTVLYQPGGVFSISQRLARRA
jgi:branched-chain amino acid transport system permease protein